MTPADRAIVAAAEERDYAWTHAPSFDKSRGSVRSVYEDRRELLRIVRALEALLRERDTQAEDRADAEAAERATAGKWGA